MLVENCVNVTNTTLNKGVCILENATYPVIIEEVSGRTIMSFPDFDIVSDVEKDKDCIKAAQEIIALCLVHSEDNGEQWPVPLSNDKFDLKPGQRLVYVNVWMPYHRTLVKTVYTRKNLTIPTWLNELAKESDVNFSEVLTEALKERLGVGL